MHPALVRFLDEYQGYLNATEEKCDITEERFAEIKQIVNTNGVTEELLSELFTLHHRLFQIAYFLMESHTRVNNIRANYSEEDQKIIDAYEDVSKRAGVLVCDIGDYRTELEKSNNHTI